MLIITPKLDANGERWIGKEKGLSDGLRLLVGSSENHEFRSRNSLVRRHIEKLDSHYKAGTPDFNLSEVGDIDSVDDLLIETTARFLLLDWEGVGEVIDGVETPIAYTPEAGISLLKQNPHLYWIILSAGSEIAKGRQEVVAESVGKRSKRRPG